MVKTLNLSFYNMMSFSGPTPSLPHRAYLMHFFRQFFYVFKPNLWFGYLKVYLTKFSQHSHAINTKIIQMCLGLRPFTMCIALATAFLTNISVFNANICYFGNISMHLGHLTFKCV